MVNGLYLYMLVGSDYWEGGITPLEITPLRECHQKHNLLWEGYQSNLNYDKTSSYREI